MTPPVLLDMTRAVGRRWNGATPSGIDRVCDAYARHFGGEALAVVQLRGHARVLSPSASRSLFAALDLPTGQFRRKLAALLLRRASSQNLSGAAYLNVGHSDFDLPAHASWLRKSDVRPVYLLHDLIPITHPQLTTPHKTRRHRGRVEHALRQAAGIIVNSQATADELMAFADGMPFPPRLVAPLGSAAMPVPLRPASSATPYFVSVGTIETRKNHMLLLRAWSNLVEILGAAAPRLVLAGNMGLGGKAVRDALASDPQLGSHVEIRSGLDDAQIAQLVAASRAMLLPTLAEGYGLPLVEALQMRVPVIASDLPSLREIGQGIPTFLDPQDDAAWAATIADFCADGAEHRRQLGKVGLFQPPGWEQHFAACEDWLAQLPRTVNNPCMDSDNRIYRPATQPHEQGQTAQC